MSLDIQIKVDPGASAGAADKVTASLHKTEDQGAATQKQMDGLTGTFKRLAQTMALDLKKAQDDLGRSLNAGSKAFDGLTEALKREQQMLERVHGPMRQLQQDIQILDKLHREGKISAEEHAKAIVKAGQAAGVSGAKPAASGADLGGIAGGIKSLNFKQAAQGAGQAFSLLNERLHIMNDELGAAVGSAVKFGAAGAQIAGPWGAAVGAITGLFVELGDDFGDWVAGRTAESKAAGQAARAYLEAVRQEESLWGQLTAKAQDAQARTDAAAESTRHLREARQRLMDLEKSDTSSNQAIDILAAQSEGYQKLTNDVRAYMLALIELQGRQGSGPMTAAQQLEVARGLRDARIRQVYAEKGYASAVADSIVAQSRAFDKQVDMTRAVADGVLNYKLLNKELGITAQRYDDLVKIFEFDFGPGASSMMARRGDLAAVDTISGGADVGTFRSQTAGMRIQAAGDVPIPGVPSAIDWERIAAANRDAQDALAEYNRKLAESEEKLTSIDDLFQGQLISSASQFSSILVDAANGADVSWKEFGLNMLTMFEKMIAQALVLQALTGSVTGAAGAGGKFGGLFGLLGFATGGSAMMTPGGLQRIPGAATGMDAIMGGASSTDQRLAMIRMTSGESLHIRTPEQRAAAARAPAGGSVVNNNVHFNPRALLQVNQTPEGRASIVNAILIDAPMIKRALGL